MAGQLTVADALNGARQVGVFAGLLRQAESLSNLLQNDQTKVVVLAPSNAVMVNLSHKPWEESSDYEALGLNAYEGEQGRERADDNVRRFVGAHIAPLNALVAGEETRTLSGTTVWVEKTETGRTIGPVAETALLHPAADTEAPPLHIKPDAVEVVEVADRCGNGELWIINGVLDSASR